MVVISHFDGLEPASQVAVIEAGNVPAIVLVKVHPIANRMPYPPHDDIHERFLLHVNLGPADPETELRIIDEARRGSSRPRSHTTCKRFA